MVHSQFPLLNSRLITYSPAFTVIPTYECFNRCSYCNFRRDPHQSPWLELDKAQEILSTIQGKGITEILILSGEIHPHSTRRQAWIQRVYDLAVLALSLGFFPHTNVGPLSFSEMALLKEVNVSMGLMLEQLTPKLMQTVHAHAPTKDPQLRLQQLEWAGKLSIPFTTGILIGIGETRKDIIDSLDAIAQIQQRWGHIQEVIIQPYSPGSREVWQGESIDDEAIINVVAIAKQILPETIAIQIPPNLVNHPQLLLKCIELGATDLGGIVPKDEVNPDYEHHDLEKLKQLLRQHNLQLQSRLPVYPQYYSWLPTNLQNQIKKVIVQRKNIA